MHDLYLKYKEKIRPYSNRSSEAWNEYLKVYHIPALDGVFNTREGLALAREMQEAQRDEKNSVGFYNGKTRPLRCLLI